MVDLKSANSFLNVLIGQKVNYICRSCELVDIGFGELIHKTNARGKQIAVPAYSLHLQCPFRISKLNKIVIGSDDLFVTLLDTENDIDLTKSNICVFDSKLKDFEENFKNKIVKDIVINQFGDMSICFDDMIISVFIAGSTDIEAWRFMDMSKNVHLIASNDMHFEID